MKTIDEEAAEFDKTRIIRIPYDYAASFKAGVKLAQQWISVEEEEHPPITEICESDGELHYSAYVLLKVKTLDYPVTGYYCQFNDDQFFDVFCKDEVKQKDITHWRLIERK